MDEGKSRRRPHSRLGSTFYPLEGLASLLLMTSRRGSNRTSSVEGGTEAKDEGKFAAFENSASFVGLWIYQNEDSWRE